MAVSDDKFTVFISHKHEDHALAVDVKDAIESLNREVIDCFVSDVDITAGMDWRREIRSALARSHMLLLLFTAPSKNWDWCLFETGLYTRFDKAEVQSRSSACSIPATLRQARSPTCRACQPTPTRSAPSRMRCAAGRGRSPTTGVGARSRPTSGGDGEGGRGRAIADAFRRSGSTSAYYPCHRVVLSLSESDDVAKGIPESAQVMEGPNDTSGLHDVAVRPGRRNRQADMGRLLRAVDGIDAPWRRELDAQFLQALDEKLFAPIAGRMPGQAQLRSAIDAYHPIIYSIDRGPAVDRIEGTRRPTGAPEPSPSCSPPSRSRRANSVVRGRAGAQFSAFPQTPHSRLGRILGASPPAKPPAGRPRGS